MYDLIIIGAGAAGMSASIYASRYKINHLVIGQVPGGQGQLAGTVENYPGYVSIPGPELMAKFLEQAKSYGVEIRQEKVGGFSIEETKGQRDKGTERQRIFEVKTDKGVYQARTLILAMGASFRSLGIPGEKEFLGRGVSYCSQCDAPFFKEKVVAVTGGGDSALTGALHLSSFAQKVYLIHRRDQFRAEPIWVGKVTQNKKIEQVLLTQITQISGQDKVESITLDKPYQGSNILKVDGVFIEIGQVPASALVANLGAELDEKGYVKVNPAMGTSVPGVFAAGDLAATQGGLLFRQFVTAAADGARAAASVYQYLHRTNPAPSWGANVLKGIKSS